VKDRVGLAECNELADEINELLAILGEVWPIDPVQFVILAIGIIVAKLTATSTKKSLCRFKRNVGSRN
jgi:hypothetical protein